MKPGGKSEDRNTSRRASRSSLENDTTRGVASAAVEHTVDTATRTSTATNSNAHPRLPINFDSKQAPSLVHGARLADLVERVLPGLDSNQQPSG